MRKYFAEFFGTAMLVAFGTGSVVFGGTSFGSFPIAIAFGFAVIAGAYAFGNISGAHFNPAISLGMAINGRISWTEFAGYVGAQILGGFAGTGIVGAIIASINPTKQQIVSAGFGATNFQTPINIWSAMALELLLTFVFVLVVMAVTAKNNEAGNMFAPLAIGVTLTALIMMGIGFTGASFNPARSIAPAVVLALFGSSSALTNIAAYIIGPLAGGALAAVVAKYLLGTEDK
ncbi:aquaporin [Weissella diestrammenae]|uniref:Aquaporin n=1 Tax=Weissella diestrammenae TaxID=1162633 RepID=A0A7G9T7C1_9LACO|nr:aquaporin [Weissella diestrammenae]MCM0582009.1 aquaporin [Weissella diestrammenae]QNN75996.1 aquaporin [Weissella diestrammenae]